MDSIRENDLSKMQSKVIRDLEGLRHNLVEIQSSFVTRLSKLDQADYFDHLVKIDSEIIVANSFLLNTLGKF